MKKFITLFLLVFSSLITIINAQEKLPEPLKETQAERIIDKYGGKIIEGFNSVVENVAPVAEQGFKIAVKLQIAKGVGYLVPFIIFIFSFRYFSKRLKEWRNSDDYNWEYPRIEVLISLIVAGVTFLVSIFTIYDAITHLVAPEWFAVKEIISLFDGTSSSGCSSCSH